MTILPQPNFTDHEVLMSLTEQRRNTIIEQRKKNEEGEFTDAEGRLRLGHLHVLKKYAGLMFSCFPTLISEARDRLVTNSWSPAIPISEILFDEREQGEAERCNERRSAHVSNYPEFLIFDIH